MSREHDEKLNHQLLEKIMILLKDLAALIAAQNAILTSIAAALPDPGTTALPADAEANLAQQGVLLQQIAAKLGIGAPVAPTLDALPALNIPVNTPSQSVSLSGIGTTQKVVSLAVSVVSDNPALVPTPTVSYTSPAPTGSLTLSPVAGQVGVANITVTVSDGVSQVNQSFAVTIA